VSSISIFMFIIIVINLFLYIMLIDMFIEKYIAICIASIHSLR